MFGKRLKIIRTEKGLLQKDLAELLNVSPSTIGMYERDQRDPDTNTLKFLAEHFNVSIDWLLGLSDITTPYSKKNDTQEHAYHKFSYTNLSDEDKAKVKEYIKLLHYKDRLIDDSCE
ncbi:hypothetical protein CACET_c21460 [Clostridium aceticum]|uniref:Uncharacterized protein n=1 Tax=Clostridium aceticum TaxID=84022 RepID=A0A0D8I9A7_9CLOT|nr:helix-turn-helix transcriptional regulator [Clostridium aceticum]AKL95593.1 hypothetical protein CACET_c21460 [Clostridium aceticum]KJF26833.1 hypothetical protein TZ02_11520 [Clostridium aceticum]